MIRSNFAPRTLEAKEKVLKTFIKFLMKNDKKVYQDLRAVKCEIVLQYMDELYLRGLQPYTIKIIMVHIDRFFKYLYKNDLISEDPSRKNPDIRIPKKTIKYIPHEEIMKKLDEMINQMTKKGRTFKLTMRDYVTGWRAGESLSCDPKNINWDTGVIYIPRRKGGKDGYAYMDMDTTTMLKMWYYSNYPNGKHLWFSKYGQVMDYQAYRKVFQRHLKVGSHRIRASTATYLISQDVGIKDVADLLGHENISSTMRYAACLKTRVQEIHALKNPFCK
jgi:site-specific recombinase XerD